MKINDAKFETVADIARIAVGIALGLQSEWYLKVMGAGILVLAILIILKKRKRKK